MSPAETGLKDEGINAVHDWTPLSLRSWRDNAAGAGRYPLTDRLQSAILPVRSGP
jgi:hypothetical protein